MRTKDQKERIDTMKLLERDFFFNQEKDKQKLNTREQLFNPCSMALFTHCSGVTSLS